MSLAFAVAINAFFVALTGAAAMRRWALQRRLLDIPSARSSHSIPTPRGGGIGIALGFFAGLTVVATNVGLPRPIAIAAVLAVGAAWLGWEDDRRGLSARARLLVQALLASVFVAVLFAQTDFFARSAPVTALATTLAPVLGLALAPVMGPALVLTLVLTLATACVCAIALVWLVNLHNFMDGIDGLAAGQGLTVALGAALLAAASAPTSFFDGNAIAIENSIAFVWLALAFAAAGFLPLNWAPARLFMGDVGSLFLGFAIASLALCWGLARPGAQWWVVALDSVFIVDATWTLAVRLARGKVLSLAHRSHAYQKAARQLGSHAAVAGAVMVYNSAVLLPLAWLGAQGALPVAAVLVFGFAPVAVACVYFRAGFD